MACVRIRPVPKQNEWVPRARLCFLDSAQLMQIQLRLALIYPIIAIFSYCNANHSPLSNTISLTDSIYWLIVFYAAPILHLVILPSLFGFTVCLCLSVFVLTKHRIKLINYLYSQRPYIVNIIDLSNVFYVWKLRLHAHRNQYILNLRK